MLYGYFEIFFYRIIETYFLGVNYDFSSILYGYFGFSPVFLYENLKSIFLFK
jgi:hypothetical protein